MDTRFSPVTQLAMFQPNTIVDLCGKGGHFAPDTRSAAEKYARKARSRKPDPSGFQVFTRENSYIGLRVTGQTGFGRTPS